MDFDPGSAENQQSEPMDASLSNAHSLAFHQSYPYNFGIVVPGFFVPCPSYTMYPNAALEQLVPTGFTAGISSVGTGSSQIQGLQLSINSQHDFDPATQFETRYSYATPGQQDWPYETAPHSSSPNELDVPQAGIVVQAFSDTHSHHDATEQQDWYNQSAARNNLPTEFEFGSQDSTTHNPVINGFDQDTSTNLFHSNRASEETHFSGSDTFDTSNTEMNLSFNTSSLLLQDISTHATIPSSSPQTSFSTSPTSPTPSPTHTSPTPPRHPCPHCTSTFARLGDLKRHTKSHFPERHRRYHCREPGCDRNGRKAFTRRDKWRDHVRGVHGLEED
ncbi:hypothetical protein V8E51_002826 [Hyaloscypha variabilis]